MMNNQQLYPCQVDIQAGNGWWKLKAKSTAGLIFGLQNHFLITRFDLNVLCSPL